MSAAVQHQDIYSMSDSQLLYTYYDLNVSEIPQADEITDKIMGSIDIYLKYKQKAANMTIFRFPGCQMGTSLGDCLRQVESKPLGFNAILGGVQIPTEFFNVVDETWPLDVKIATVLLNITGAVAVSMAPLEDPADVAIGTLLALYSRADIVALAVQSWCRGTDNISAQLSVFDRFDNILSPYNCVVP
jgi:hypothetical protein